MTQKEFDEKYPLILSWIKSLVAEHAANAQSVASLGFKRLPQYFLPEALAAAKVVYVPKVPVPPLSAMGLTHFAHFENMNAGGTTYLDTFFSRNELRGDEAHHFHELVHILQWQLLSPKSFISAFSNDLERIGYRKSPLETMAYTLASVFKNSDAPFDVATIVREQIRELYF
ncbi:MAG: hypothetical protein P4M10_08860 [Verrucomicrobiae bacterium]|nr:hypothetical protein [Verrucomicrobiae bacterium]